MARTKFGVGIIGIQPERSWAAVAHIPALRALSDFEVTALSTTRIESAQAAGAALGVDRVYDNHMDLVSDPAVDIVAVTVKVPHHLELVSAAIQAGKHVYCEWPLGNGLAEAELLAQKARAAGVRCVVGTQARFSPEIRFIRQMIADGYVGRVLSSSIIGSGLVWGSTIDSANAYTMASSNGATMLTIPIGHSLDAMCACLGELSEVNSSMSVLQSEFLNVETGHTATKTSPDQIAIIGTFESGAILVCHYRAGASRGTNLLWEINGTEGDLLITADAGHLQMFPLTISGGQGEDRTLAPLSVPKHYRTAPEELAGPSVNVAQLWQCFADDLRTGGQSAPSFDDAVRRHNMLAAIEQSATSGSTISIS